MSHVKNMHAFEKLLGHCTGYGGSYNPGQQNLQVEALTTLWLNANQKMNDVIRAQTVYDTITNQRERAFEEIKRLSTRVINVLIASGADKLAIADARARVRKLWGNKSTDRLPIASPTAQELKERKRKARGTDYPSMAAHFASLVETVMAEPKYHPNEPFLTVTGLKDQLAIMQTLNSEVIRAQTELADARKQRDELMYSEDGMIVRARAVKFYMRAAFGFLSEERKELSRIHFTKNKI
jgi:hypothetical protein